MTGNNNLLIIIMSAGSFEQDSLGWHYDLIRQRIGEWVELKTSQMASDAWESGFLQSKLLWQIVKVCLWLLIALLLVLILWQLSLVIHPYWKRWQKNARPFSTEISQSTLQLSVNDWVERSQIARVEGNYRQAIFCLYQAMLEILDQQGIISTQLSLTDLEYQRSLQQLQVSPLSPYELLLSIHQQLCFSQAPADQYLFEQCLQAYQQIASLISN